MKPRNFHDRPIINPFCLRTERSNLLPNNTTSGSCRSQRKGRQRKKNECYQDILMLLIKVKLLQIISLRNTGKNQSDDGKHC